jgi:hypothetical protein
MTHEFGRQYELWDCPFCGENSISVIRFPKSVSVKSSKTALIQEQRVPSSRYIIY